MNYAIVIPAKNEEKTIGETLHSVATQTIPPVKCIVVDDGSTDRTSEIVRNFDREYDFIVYHQNKSQAQYRVGGHVVNMFYIGKKWLDDQNIDYDYLIKLDADISFDK